MTIEDAKSQACLTATQKTDLEIILRDIDRNRLKYELMVDAEDDVGKKADLEQIKGILDDIYTSCADKLRSQQHFIIDSQTKGACEELIKLSSTAHANSQTDMAVSTLSELKGYLLEGLIKSQVRVVEAFDRQSIYCTNMSNHPDLEDISPSHYVHGARDVRKECQKKLESVICSVKEVGFSEPIIADAFDQLSILKKLGSRADYKTAAEMSARLQRALMDQCKTPMVCMEDLLDDAEFSGFDTTLMMNSLTIMHIEELSQRLGQLKEHAGMVDRTYGTDFNADLHPYVKTLHENLLTIRDLDMPDVEMLSSILMDFAEQDIDLAWHYSMMFLAALEAKNSGVSDAVTFCDVDDENIYGVLGDRRIMTIARSDLFTVKRDALKHFNVSDAKIAELDEDVSLLVTEYFWCDKNPLATPVKNSRLLSAEGCFVIDIYNAKETPSILRHAAGVPFEDRRRDILESAVLSYARGGAGLEGTALQMYARMPRQFLQNHIETSDTSDQFLWRRPLKPECDNYAFSGETNMHIILLGTVYADPHTKLVSRKVFMQKAPHLRYTE